MRRGRVLRQHSGHFRALPRSASPANLLLVLDVPSAGADALNYGRLERYTNASRNTSTRVQHKIGTYVTRSTYM